MLEALSLEARTRGKDRRRKLSAFLSLSLSLHSSPLLFTRSWPPSSSLLSPYRLSNNAPLCSATLEPCIFLDAMDFPKAFRCFASTLYRLASPRRALFPTISRLRTFVPPIDRIARRTSPRDWLGSAPVASIGTRPPRRLPRDRLYSTTKMTKSTDRVIRFQESGVAKARSMVGNAVRGKTSFRDDDAIAARVNDAASNEPKRASDSDGSIGSRVRTEADRMSQTRLNPRDAKQWLYRANERASERATEPATDRPTDQNRQWNTECRGWRPWHRPVSHAVHLPSVCETFFLVSIRRTQETQRRPTIKKLAALEFFLWIASDTG